MVRYLIFGLLFILSHKALPQKSKGDEIYQQAKAQLDKGEKQKALRGFLNARDQYLKEANYYWALTAAQNVAMYYQDTAEGKAAEQVLLETVSLIPQDTKEQLSTHASLQDNLGYTYANVLNDPEKALACYNESIRLYEKTSQVNTTSWAFELVNRATTYFDLNNFQSAAEDMLKAISTYETDKETKPDAVAGYYRTLGRIYSEMSYDTKAIASYQKAFSLIENSDNRKLKATLQNDLGGAYMNLNKPAAMEHLQKALALNEEEYGKDASNFAMTLSNIADVRRSMGDLEEAVADYQQVLLIYQKTPPDDATHIIDAMIEISKITGDMGMYEVQEELLLQAHNLAITSYGANSLEEADVYMQKAVTAYGHGQFDQSLTFNFKALDIMQQNKYPENAYYAQIYNNVGQAYDALKDADLALKFKTQALELYTKLRGPDHRSVAMATANIGLSYEVTEDYTRAIEYLKKSVAIRLKTPEQDDDLGLDYLNIGLMYLKKNETKQGIEFLEKALVIYDKHDKNINKAMICNRLSLGYFALHDLPKAKSYNQEAIMANALNFDDSNFDAFPDKPVTLDYYESIIAYTAKADIYTKQGDLASLMKGLKILDAADKTLKDKVLSLAKANDRLELAELNAFFTESGMLLVDKLYQVTKNPVYLEKAFYFSERSKANELLADIQLNKASALSRIPKEITNRKEELGRRMNTLQQQVADAYATQNQQLITKLKSQEFDLSKELESLQLAMEKASPKFKSALNQRVLPSWQEVKKKLDAKTALVSYIITDSAKYILIGNSSKLILKSIPAKTDLEKLVRGFTVQVKFRGPDLQGMTEKLTDILWAPVESAFAELGPVEKVIILPQGPLNFLPFEALGKGTYLTEKYTIYYQLSGALIANQPPSQVGSKATFIALAPVFEDLETNFVNKSCERFVKLSKKADTTSRAFNLNGDYISPLPETETEVKTINKIYVDNGLFSKIFIKQAANEELIKSGELANFDYIHLATHGFVNSQYPELSGLLLTQNKNSSEDGILYSGEILGLSLKAELVTLSACETALGKKVEGEGVRGLTTAFLFAGARSVISSLWKVADESTSIMMIDFYTKLYGGKDKASALRLAKLALLKDPKYSHPYYWAPFILTGG